MPFEMSLGHVRKKIAVVGSGISGLGAAYALADVHDVTIFEAERRIGGHARTVLAGRNRDIPVDTGFIVYNERNYPRLTALFHELSVPTKPSDMSFAASFDGGGLEYGLRGAKALFAQRRNLVRPAYLGMLRDILAFNRKAERALDRPNLTLGAFLDELGLGEAVRQWYLLPFSGAIWSATPAEMVAFPAATFVRFFKNHGLLSAHGQPLWRTVDGGSQVYVDRLAAALRAKGATIHTGAPAEAVIQGDQPCLRIAGHAPEAFDAIVLACHADQALHLLDGAGTEQTRILKDLRYKPNRIVLHDDARQMPRRRACWSSWNYLGARDGEPPAIGVTYWMNRLQSLPATQPLFVTLNPSTEIPDEHVFDETELSHPQFDGAAIAAQAELSRIQGLGGLYFAGAYARFGFHEDGLASGLNVARELGAAPSWA